MVLSFKGRFRVTFQLGSKIQNITQKTWKKNKKIIAKRKQII
jgi:hypothetical protein